MGLQWQVQQHDMQSSQLSSLCLDQEACMSGRDLESDSIKHLSNAVQDQDADYLAIMCPCHTAELDILKLVRQLSGSPVLCNGQKMDGPPIRTSTAETICHDAAIICK